MLNRKKEVSQDESTDERDERTEQCDGYPFAFMLRMRVVQVVCGISTMLMGSVATIEEKAEFNMGLGIPAGIVTVLAAANSIYSSRGFDGYQPSACKPSSSWSKLRFLGPTVRVATGHVALWGAATALLCVLSVKAVQTLLGLDASATVATLAVIQLALSVAVLCAMATTVWVDIHYDPD